MRMRRAGPAARHVCGKQSTFVAWHGMCYKATSPPSAGCTPRTGASPSAPSGSLGSAQAPNQSSPGSLGAGAVIVQKGGEQPQVWRAQEFRRQLRIPSHSYAHDFRH